MTHVVCRSHRRSIRGGNIYWEEWSPNPARGEERRPPVVLLHGLGDTCQTWNRIVPSLARDRRIYALDLPGHGRTSRYDGDYDIRWYARLVAEWIQTLDCEEFSLIGHSLGGGVSLRLLRELPGRIHRLALIASGGLGLEIAVPLRVAARTRLLFLTAPVLMGVGTHAGAFMVGGQFDGKERKHLVEMNGRPGTVRTFERTLRKQVDFLGQREHVADHAHVLGELPPIAAYWGDRDPVIPVRHADFLHETIEDVVVKRFANVRHYPHREIVPELLSELFRFLDNPQRSTRLRPGVKPPRVPESPLSSLWHKIVGAPLSNFD